MNADLTLEHTSKNIVAELGLTAPQRSAEIVASLRAVTFPSPEADSLSSPAGRAFARFLSDLSGSEAINNATGGRHICITRLAEQILAEKSHPKRIVELACGFSGRGLKLAQALPNTQIIEIDLPDVVAAKQARVRRMVGGQVPKNLSWIAADLSSVTIPDMLGVGSVDLLLCEGMLPYFTPREIGAIAAAARTSLARFGVLIADAVRAQGWQAVENATKIGTWIFHRQAGKFTGKFENGDDLRGLIEQAGYAEVSAYHLRALAQEFLPGKPVADVSFVVVARNG